MNESTYNTFTMNYLWEERAAIVKEVLKNVNLAFFQN
ncbi:hypothetical protein BC751_2965 [Cecembia calidifontis]|uniref:Uncharacterized protein n=1 Tax=Cecembia calidifontis TaxID=1187080 RepID=A0A4V2F6S7_9BACT|nr:hypothetical protein BC751_2965 [Cecembia calidifontis]